MWSGIQATPWGTWQVLADTHLREILLSRLYLVAQRPDIVQNSKPNGLVILTPNAREFELLAKAVLGNSGASLSEVGCECTPSHSGTASHFVLHFRVSGRTISQWADHFLERCNRLLLWSFGQGNH